MGHAKWGCGEETLRLRFTQHVFFLEGYLKTEV